jgi:hypothetical protein
METEISFLYSKRAATAPRTKPVEAILPLYNQQFDYYPHIQM